MNDLDAALRATYEARSRTPEPPALLDEVLAIPDLDTPHQRSWLPHIDTVGFTMFSTLKFVAAGVIVALFGGFLLAGVFTTQQPDEMAPAAVSDSPSPMTTEELLSGMVTEEVEPGIFRIDHDGVRDLTSVDNRDIVAGFDGGIWLLREEEFLRLGSEGSHRWPARVGPGSHVLEVAPDGTMWVIPLWKMRLPADVRKGSGLRSNDGEEWTVQPCPQDCIGVTVAPDGTLWASWIEGDETRVGHLGPTGWQSLDGDLRYGELSRLLFTDAGDLYGRRCNWECSLDRFGDGAWQRESAIRELVDVAPDGTVWLGVRAQYGEPPPFGEEQRLARFAGGEWAEWTSADLPDISLGFGRDHEFKAAPDGSLWFSLWRSADGRDPREDDFWGGISEPVQTGYLVCDGLARFDGQALDRFLPGQCISMDIAADGSVWVLAADGMPYVFDGDTGAAVFDDDHTWDLYVITPEVVAATE